MFRTQKEFISSLESLLFETLEDSINQFDFVVKDYVTNKQLFREGIDGKGNKLEGYRRATIRLKLRKGDPIDRTTLRDEGKFYAEIEIKAFSDRFEVSSNVPYDKYILKRYGKDVLKITNENLKDFIDNYFIPKFRKNVKDKITR